VARASWYKSRVRGIRAGACGVTIVLCAALAGCIGVPIGTPGGRARVVGAAAFGDIGGQEQGAPAISFHTGIAPASYWPERREWDVEAGYVLTGFTDVRGEEAQGGYVGASWMPHLAALGNGANMRAILGGDVEMLALRGVAGFGGTASFGVEVYGRTSGDGFMAGASGGVAGAAYGEWAIGIVLEGSYRYSAGEHYGTVGAGLSLRWPAAGGVVFATAIGLGIAAANSQSSSGQLSGGDTEVEWNEHRGDLPEDPPAPPGRFVCTDSSGNAVEADALEEARSLCPGCECVER
jgi:hypothetical protein